MKYLLKPLTEIILKLKKIFEKKNNNFQNTKPFNLDEDWDQYNDNITF